jgi:hypothetical protein
MVAPLADEGESVATGPDLPLAEERESVFVQLQWAVRAYEFARTGRYRPRLRGHNAVVRRAALEDAGGFVDVFGDDYELGVRLQHRGHRLRFVGDGAVETAYLTNAGDYVRQQARWMRAVMVEAPRLGRYGDAARSTGVCVVGGAMLALTALALGRRRSAGLLLLPLLHAYLGRVRRLRFAGRIGLFRPRAAHYVGALGHAYLDFAARARVLLEYASSKRRERW